MDITGLEEAVSGLMQQGVSESTRKCYESSIKCYIAFCNQCLLSCLPAAERTVSLYCKISSKTVRIYLASSCFERLGVLWHTPKIELLLRGVARQKKGSVVPIY